VFPISSSRKPSSRRTLYYRRTLLPPSCRTQPGPARSGHHHPAHFTRLQWHHPQDHCPHGLADPARRPPSRYLAVRSRTAAVWTSDLKGQWGTRWIGWESFPRFSSQLVGWLLPAPQIEGLTTQAELEDGKAVIRLEALDEFGRPRNFLNAQATIIDPDLNPAASTLTQVGPGKYEAQVDAAQPGSYLIRLGVSEGDQSLGQGTLGLVVPYSPEYRASGVQTSLLDDLAAITGGGRVGNVMEVFEKNIPSADFAREIWRPLLLAVALLFPLDVAVRRVMLGSSDFRKAGQWFSERLPSRSTRPASGERTLNELFQARDRARQRRRQPDSPQQPPYRRQPVLARTSILI
jgi:Ca-activated chloride channel homolog